MVGCHSFQGGVSLGLCRLHVFTEAFVALLDKETMNAQCQNILYISSTWHTSKSLMPSAVCMTLKWCAWLRQSGQCSDYKAMDNVLVQ